MKKIKLTQGQFAVVDDCDFQHLSQWKWYAAKDRNTFYAARGQCINGKRKHIKMHRVVGERMGLDLRLEIDHKDRNGLNNQRLNLRSATDKQQKENQRTYKNNTSGYRGVCWEKGKSKWRAKIQHNGKLIHLGYFDTSKDASIIYEKKRKELFTRHGESNA